MRLRTCEHLSGNHAIVIYYLYEETVAAHEM